MITTANIRKKALNMYSAYLVARLNGDPFFPRAIRSDKKPSEKQILTLKNELLPLLEHSKNKLGYGYLVKLRTVRTTKLSEQQLPDEIVFETEYDYLHFLNKEEEVSHFQVNSALVLKKFPQLKNWIQRFPQKVIAKSDYWQDLLKVLDYFVENPKPNLYIRELPIAVHTKFIEQHVAVLEELLWELIPSHINPTGESFSGRFSLKHYEPYFHIRILDYDISKKHFSGLSDIGVTLSELNNLIIPITRVVIMENKQNYKNIDSFLTLPQMQGTIAIFGAGFRSGALKKIKWLKEKELYYWGDIDVHGFQILSQVRQSYPGIIAWMMNRETLDRFQDQWGKGASTNVENLSGLHTEELALFKYLKEYNIRLEQEKITQEYVIQFLQAKNL